MYVNKHQKCLPQLPPASLSHCASFPHSSLRHKAPPRAGPCPSPRGSPLPPPLFPLPSPQPPPCSGKRAPHLRGAAALRNGPGRGKAAQGRWRRAAPAPCPHRAVPAPRRARTAGHPRPPPPPTPATACREPRARGEERRGEEGSAGGLDGAAPGTLRFLVSAEPLHTKHW